VAEDARRQVNEEVCGEVEARQPRQAGERPRPDVRQAVVGQPQVAKVAQSGEDVVREEPDDVARQRQTQQQWNRVERVGVDVAESVVVQIQYLQYISRQRYQPSLVGGLALW